MSKEIQTTSSKLEPQFTKVLTQIQQARQRAYSQVNKTLVALYWNIGQYISRQAQNNGWGKRIVEDLSVFLKYKDPNIKGFSARNIWTMKQFYEIYQQDEKLPSLMAELSCTHNRRIMSLKTAEERAFYLLLCSQQKFNRAHLGQLEFYLEALDRDVKLSHENPSIGVLLCREKNDEVVQYALSRSVSPAIISDYETKLIPKEVLKKKLNEFYELLEGGE